MTRREAKVMACYCLYPDRVAWCKRCQTVTYKSACPREHIAEWLAQKSLDMTRYPSYRDHINATELLMLTACGEADRLPDARTNSERNGGSPPA